MSFMWFFHNKYIIISNMKSSEYTKIVIENAGNLVKTNENDLYIIKDKIYPGMIYRIRGLVLLCTCYEINEDFEPILYFFMLLEGKIKNAIYSKNINPNNLVLIKNIDNEINYKKILQIYNEESMKSYLK
jgi:hypothetical protein